jgi:CBS domain-containing protein
MSVGRICSRTTHLVAPTESAQTAAERMKRENVGTLLVLDEEKKPIGILTDRDIVLRVVASGLDAPQTTVGRILTAHPRSVSEETPIEDAVALMRTLGVRRLPVVDGRGRLAGIVSLDDVLELLTEELADVGKTLGASRPGSRVPAAKPATPEPAARKAAAPKRRPDGRAGLQRASSDPEC